MLQQLAGFVTPITDPFSQMQGHFTQLSVSLQTMNTRLQSQVQALTIGAGNEGYQGLGAQAFSAAIAYYLGISKRKRLSPVLGRSWPVFARHRGTGLGIRL